MTNPTPRPLEERAKEIGRKWLEETGHWLPIDEVSVSRGELVEREEQLAIWTAAYLAGARAALGEVVDELEFLVKSHGCWRPMPDYIERLKSKLEAK